MEAYSCRWAESRVTLNSCRIESSWDPKVCCGLCQIASRVKEAMEPTSGLKGTHLPGMKAHVEELREEIIQDDKPLSMVRIVTDDADLLKALGSSGVAMVAPAEDDSNGEGGSEV